MFFHRDRERKRSGRRLLGLSLSACLLLAGCGGGQAGGAPVQTDGSETAMGRYIEEEVALPDSSAPS